MPTQWSATSNIKWKTPIPGEGWSSPIVSGDSVFVTTATDGGKSLHLIRLDRRDGKIVWDKEIARQEPKYKQRPNSYATPTPVTDGQRVYVSVCDGRILAVDLDGKVVWTNERLRLLQPARTGAFPPSCTGTSSSWPSTGAARGPTRRWAGRSHGTRP